jgi:acetyltransferase-like isoleucine patch superfamily enzyme
VTNNASINSEVHGVESLPVERARRSWRAISRNSESLDVEIGTGCWIGARATILGGVRIGDDVVVAAGAVVTRNCEGGGTYAGVPAVRIK